MRPLVFASLALVFWSMSLQAQDQIIIASPEQSQPKFDATVHISAHIVALGVGFGWGRGVVHYEGVDQAFCVRGWSIGDFGVARLNADGVVFKLSDLNDFAGRYLADNRRYDGACRLPRPIGVEGPCDGERHAE